MLMLNMALHFKFIYNFITIVTIQIIPFHIIQEQKILFSNVNNFLSILQIISNKNNLHPKKFFLVLGGGGGGLSSSLFLHLIRQ
jgi:hypothetical protein